MPTPSFRSTSPEPIPRKPDSRRWQRTIRLNRGQSVTVEEAYELDHTPQTLILSLLTASQVELDQPGEIRLSAADLPDGRVAGSGLIHYDADRFTASVETISTNESGQTGGREGRMAKVWGDLLYRILLTANNPLPQDTWKLTITQ